MTKWLCAYVRSNWLSLLAALMFGWATHSLDFTHFLLALGGVMLWRVDEFLSEDEDDAE